MWLRKSICAVSNFIAIIISCSVCQMLAYFRGVKFLRTTSKLKTRKSKSSSVVVLRSRPPYNDKLGRLTSYPKAWLHVQICCFACSSLFLFWCSRCRCKGKLKGNWNQYKQLHQRSMMEINSLQTEINHYYQYTWPNSKTASRKPALCGPQMALSGR